MPQRRTMGQAAVPLLLLLQVRFIRHARFFPAAVSTFFVCQNKMPKLKLFCDPQSERIEPQQAGSSGQRSWETLGHCISRRRLQLCLTNSLDSKFIGHLKE